MSKGSRNELQVFRDGLQDMSRRQNKSFSVQQFFKNAAEVHGEQPTFAKQIRLCNFVFLLQLHSLKLSYSNKIVNYENQGCKFEQGNGAIAARWQAKAGVEPPFAGR